MPRTMDQLFEYCALHGLGGAKTCRGSSDDEISTLESKYGVTVPLTYRQFLAHMGHNSGRLFAHDHTIVSYAEAMNLMDELPELIRQESPNFDPKLPEDAVLIGSRLGDWLWFIRCSDSIESPVWSFGISGEHPVQMSCESFVEWLFTWAFEAATILEQS